MFPNKVQQELTNEEHQIIGDAMNKRMGVGIFFRWRANASVHGGQRARQKSAFQCSANPSQLKLYEMYSKMYYSERIQPKVQEELAACGVSKAQRAQIPVIQKVIKELYDQENDDIKQEVLKKIEENIPNPDSSAPRTPEQYQR
jgi:ABC-type uncharacterized transport system YnjBCD ATPase subunit